jgi:hypothetical protein
MGCDQEPGCELGNQSDLKNVFYRNKNREEIELQDSLLAYCHSATHICKDSSCTSLCIALQGSPRHQGGIFGFLISE